jgi:MFS family permease
MFLFPNYIIKDYSLGQATRILLLGFFIGNIISSLLSAYYWSKLGNPFGFMLISLIIFISLMSNFAHISETYLWLYSCGLGCIGGGYPIVCTQLLAHEYPVYIRSLASNALTALGRLSGIIFNLLITNWLMNKQAFIHQVIYTSIIVFLLALGSLILSRKNIQNQVVV